MLRQAFTYWKTTLAGEPLSSSASDIYALLEDGIATGLATPLSSRTFMERIGDWFAGMGEVSLRRGASSHPIISGVLAVLSLASVWGVYRCCVAGGTTSEERDGYRKVE